MVRGLSASARSVLNLLLCHRIKQSLPFERVGLQQNLTGPRASQLLFR